MESDLTLSLCDGRIRCSRPVIGKRFHILKGEGIQTITFIPEALREVAGDDHHFNLMVRHLAPHMTRRTAGKFLSYHASFKYKWTVIGRDERANQALEDRVADSDSEDESDDDTPETETVQIVEQA